MRRRKPKETNPQASIANEALPTFAFGGTHGLELEILEAGPSRKDPSILRPLNVKRQNPGPGTKDLLSLARQGMPLGSSAQYGGPLFTARRSRALVGRT